ncbi:DUF3379 family protein [Algicola sagamiensis]|uniref:DUF3379 family protein n=1 Tax=Algicola sagamiensis TaxID=163869 RepID=UPI00037A5BCD|nr:DUF3379 family protein [Algicola sagamiensis]
MDDLEFRRQLFADPDAPDVKDVAKNDPAKQKSLQEAQALNAKIHDALNIDVPENLEQRLILRQTLESHKVQQRKSRLHLAMAASIAFAVGLGINQWQFSPVYDSLSQQALAHVYHELDAVNTTGDDENYALGQVNAKLASFGGQFIKEPAKFTYANFCRFDSILSLHLIVQGEYGKVSLFVIPKEDSLPADGIFSDQRFQGDTLQSEKANVIIIGEKGEPIPKWKSRIQEDIRWQT